MFRINLSDYRFITCILFCVFISCSHKHQPSNSITVLQTSDMPYATTFDLSQCDRMILQYHKKMSDQGAGIQPQAKELKEVETILNILELLRQLPDEGDIMIKMGDVPVLEMILYQTSAKPIVIRYYDAKLQTPATSFYPAGKYKREAELYALLMSAISK